MSEFTEAWLAMRGPQHVVFDCDEGIIEDVGFDPRGMPVREVYGEAKHGPYQRMLDTVYDSGQEMTIVDAPTQDGRPGTLVIVPLKDERGVWGVSLLWRATQRVDVPLVVGLLPLAS